MKTTIAIFLTIVGIVIVSSALISKDTETSVGIEKIGDNVGLDPNASDVEIPDSMIYGSAEIRVPAIDENENGVVTSLRVESKAGNGKTMVDINQLLFWVDTQYSIQTAKAVAENYTNANLSMTDIIYSIDTEAYLIEGPSAGAALTVATIAAIYNKTVNETIMITGTINFDGSIGEVGGVAEKAEAAKDIGASLFIVPKGQILETTYTKQRICQEMGLISYCRTEYITELSDIREQVDIDIVEASDIGEALKYFFG